MSSDHITDAQIDAFMNTWCGMVDWRQGIPGHIVSAKVAELRAALLAAERVAWRPIETAPRDGTHVLVFWECEDGEEFQSVAWWDVEFDVIDNDEPAEKPEYRGAWIDGSVADWGMEETEELHPTHWRPLPPPPEGV